jgi:hypothetical protein
MTYHLPLLINTFHVYKNAFLFVEENICQKSCCSKVFITEQQKKLCITGGIYIMKEIRLKVLGVRLSETQVSELRQRAEAKHLTLSTLGRVLFELFLKGEIQV